LNLLFLFAENLQSEPNGTVPFVTKLHGADEEEDKAQEDQDKVNNLALEVLLVEQKSAAKERYDNA
jgi:hypothetical protein